MAETDQDQKTEQPTEKKLSEAMERGQFARSPELSVLLLLLAVVGGLGFTAKAASRELADYSIGIFSRFATIKVEADTVSTQMGEALLVCGRVLTPILFACVGAAILSGG